MIILSLYFIQAHDCRISYWFYSIIKLVLNCVLKLDLFSGYSGIWGKNELSGPRNLWATRGSSITLPCPLISADIPSISMLNVTWLKNNHTIVNDRRHVLTEQGHLNITRVSLKNFQLCQLAKNLNIFIFEFYFLMFF